MLVLPSGVIEESFFTLADAAEDPGLLGPSTTATCRAVALTEAGDWVAAVPPQQIQVRIVDFDAAVVAGLSPLAAGTLDYSPFVQADPMLFPLAVEVAAAAHAWVRTRPGDRGANGYVTAEEPPDPEERPAAPLGRQPKGRGGDAKAKRPTLAGLAASQATLQELVVSLVEQVQTLTEVQAKAVPSALPAAPVQQAAPLPVAEPTGHAALKAPLHAMLPPAPARAKRLSDILGPPPPIRAHAWPQESPVDPDPDHVTEPLPGITDDELRGGPSEPLAQAMLLQAKALTTLVGQLAGSTPDSLIDLPASSVSTSTKGTTGRLKIQAELAQRDGSFFDRTFAAAGRRMDPTSVPGSSGLASGLQTSMAAYLERFGGYHKDRTIGLAQWQCAIAMDLLAKGETKGAGDTLAMLMIFFEQATLDGNPDLGWLMTHLADPPNGVFQDRTVTPTTSLRPFSPLADQRLVATTLAFVKELEALSTRKNEVSKPKAPKTPPKLPDAGAKQEEAAPTRKQLRAQLWAAKKSSAQT